MCNTFWDIHTNKYTLNNITKKLWNNPPKFKSLLSVFSSCCFYFYFYCIFYCMLFLLFNSSCIYIFLFLCPVCLDWQTNTWLETQWCVGNHVGFFLLLSIGQLHCKSSVLYLFSNNSLSLNLSGLWVFELLGLVNVQEKVLQQTLSLAQLVWNLSLMLEGQLFLVVFSILVQVDSG